MSCKDNKQKEYSFFKSVTFQSWTSFLLLIFIIVGIMLVSFALVYIFLYGREKVNGATNAARTIVSSYPTNWSDEEQVDRFETVVKDNARNYNLSIAIFDIEGDVANASVENVKDLQYYGYSESNADGMVLLKRVEESLFSRFAAEEPGAFFYTTYERSRNVEVVMGAVQEYSGHLRYFCISSYVADRDFAFDFFSRMMLGIALLTFAISLVYAYLTTRKITSPLINFTKQIKLASQNKDHVYEIKGNGYAEIDLLANALNESIIEQRKTEEFRRDLLSNVSHDLRTPLTMIKAYSEMIRDLSGNNPQKRDEHCNIIIDEVERLNVMVGDLLDLSKIQAGTVGVELKPNSLSYITKTVVERLNIFRERDGYEFVLDIDEDCLCECDSTRTEQAVYNLVCNAINYTGEDKKVYVSLKKRDGKIRFEVRDTGKGIKKEEQEHIWERYYRTQRSKRSVAGSGIGLAIVQSIFVLQNIEYGVISEENEGATFWFEIEELKADEE